MFDSLSFKEIEFLDELNLIKSKDNDRYDPEIIGMALCHNERFLAVITGINLIMNE